MSKPLHIVLAIALLHATVVSAAPVPRSDPNGDRKTDVLDLQCVMGNVLQGEEPPQVDVNGDGQVNLLDYQALLLLLVDPESAPEPFELSDTQQVHAAFYLSQQIEWPDFYGKRIYAAFDSDLAVRPRIFITRYEEIPPQFLISCLFLNCYPAHAPPAAPLS
jgi:hypothetical protein